MSRALHAELPRSDQTIAGLVWSMIDRSSLAAPTLRPHRSRGMNMGIMRLDTTGNEPPTISSYSSSRLVQGNGLDTFTTLVTWWGVSTLAGAFREGS